MTVRLRLFGSPTIDNGGELCALPFERRSQLLVFLAMKRGWVGRAELATMLWPEQQSKLAYSNLRKTLFRLQSLPWATGIQSQDGAVRCEAETDVVRFESALREHRVADALTLRRGELLAGFDDHASEAWSSWLDFERDRLRGAWRSAALERLAMDIDPGEGIDLSAQLLDTDPLDETALRAHMSWLTRHGQSARARQAYRAFVDRLEHDLGLSPGPQLKALHDSLGTTYAIPTEVPFKAPPTPDDGFVGRSIELQRIAELLGQDDCRLLCLIGPGGVGKTRLAQRALRELAPTYADGGAWVGLEDVAASSEVGSRLARDLGLSLSGSAEPLDQVIGFLGERHMLLALDNFEHLAADASILEKLLQSCAQLRIIVTSRARLALTTEWLLPLDGLPCPEMEDSDRIEAFDAARLFVEAARRVEPALIPAAEATAIVDICRLVGGLPLALELAAAWTRVLSCETIAVELRQGTELLRAVDAAHMQRHASIEVVFEHSWRLLTQNERDALSRLSVFRGGFTAEAARAVAGASLPVLGALADKSLLRKDEQRIFLHPLVQQLAAVRLGDGNARASAAQAHAHYFHRLLAQLERTVEDGDREALHCVEVEFENCRVAWRWATAHAETDALAKSAPTLLSFCDHRSRLEEGLGMLRDSLELPAVGAKASVRALLLSAAASLQYRLDRYADAEATATGALEAARLTGDRSTRSRCFKVLGSCNWRLGRYGDAKRFFERALQQARASSDPRSAAALLDNLALVEKAMGRYEAALSLSIQSLAQHQRLGDVAGEALCLNNLGVLLMDTGQPDPAGVHLKAGLAVCERHGLASTHALILANRTELAMKTGDDDSAQTYAQRAFDAAEASGSRFLASWVKLHFMRLGLRRGDLVAARLDLGASLRIAIAIDNPPLQVTGVSCFAELLAAQGEPGCARLVLAFAADHPSIGTNDRDEMHARLAQWSANARAKSAWPGLELDELVHRIVNESDLAHAPLIATLRDAT